MISLRYHFLSLVAIFLSLSIGILIGSAFVMRGDIQALSRGLRSEFAKVREEVRKERELSQKREQILANYRKLAKLITPTIVRGKLLGQAVGILPIGKVDDKTVSDLEEVIESAGGEIRFTIFLYPQNLMAREDLENVLNTLARNLYIGNKEGLRGMEKENIIRIEDWKGSAMKIIIISDKQADKDRVQKLDIPLISYLKAEGLRIIGGEEFAPAFSPIPYYKSLGISTVDCLDYEVGQIASVLLLSGEEGNYGMGKDADDLLPPLKL
ncbi:copper transporter [bacterium]|nr:copper transporter [bacterium]